MTGFKIQKQIFILAPPGKVWQGLTDPSWITRYLFGTQAVSEWKEESPLFFRGEYQGTSYEDKGIIRIFRPDNTFQYTYLSSFSGLEDRPENYQIITWSLKSVPKGTQLELTQENINSQEAADHTEMNWEFVLQKMKELLEA